MMSTKFCRKHFAAVILLLALACLSAFPANAGESNPGRVSCWTASSLAEDFVKLAQTADRWACSTQKLAIDAERVLLRFDINPKVALPRYLLARRSPLDVVHLLAVDHDGAVRHVSMPAASLASSVTGGYFSAPLPEVTQATRYIVAAIDLPSHRMTLETAQLAPTDAFGSTADMRFLLILAGIAGMLVVPLIFNAAFYRVLRQPFVLWHTALTLSLLMTILVSSGLSVIFFNPPAMVLSTMTTVIFGTTIASAVMFTYSFIEPGLMHPLLRRLLPYCAAWAMLLSAFHAGFPFVARPIQSSAYSAAFAPILAVFLAALFNALKSGSRAAKFQAVGYAPMILVGVIRLVTSTNPALSSMDALPLLYFGCMCEVLFTTLGMADRFMAIKLERDRALTEARSLERLSQTDPLTGLLNRRALEQDFDQLRTRGFTTLAIIDLDHFKAVNDQRGHAVGDEVLKAVASALQADLNVRAYRLGGEEFALFLRGNDAHLQAERRRRAIPAIVATHVPALESPVTASMGLTDISGDEIFAAPYERADKLLYEAKNGGRNQARTASKSGSGLGGNSPGKSDDKRHADTRRFK